MSSTKLILLEGIPGSGKTTAGLHLEQFLKDRAPCAQFWREGNFDHPADFEGVACLTQSQYKDFLSRYPELISFFDEGLTVQGNDYLLWYRKMQSLHPEETPQPLVDELSRHDVYDGLPMHDYCRLALRRWSDFQASAESSDEITILECCFLQNPLTVMLARHNADPQLARQHILQIARIIADLNPLVIYLAPLNVRNALEHVRAERPKEWADFVTWYLTGQDYGNTHQLSGYEGVIQFYEMRQKLELDILKSLCIPSLVIQHEATDWDRSDHDIVEFVESASDWLTTATTFAQ